MEFYQTMNKYVILAGRHAEGGTSWISRAAAIVTRSVSEGEEPTEFPRLRFGLRFSMFRLPHKMFTAAASPAHNRAPSFRTPLIGLFESIAWFF